MRKARVTLQLYLFVSEGAATVNENCLAGGDQARIDDETSLTITATAQTELLLIDRA